jgi:hypothetical protein
MPRAYLFLDTMPPMGQELMSTEQFRGFDRLHRQTFNVLIKSPISKTASFQAKTHVWPIDGSAQGLTNQQSLLDHIQAKT